MSRFTQVLDPALLGDVAPHDLSERSGIPLDRLTELLENRESPTVFELGELAEALSMNPIYLIRPRPSVIARRDSGVNNAQMDVLLERYDLHVAAYTAELAQPSVAEAFPARNSWGARSAGEGWATRHETLWAGLDHPNLLMEVIETEMRIPILTWPIPGAPFGATLRLDDTLAIWVNSHNVPGTQQRFTLAHELGHILLKHTDMTRVEQTSTPEKAPSMGSPNQRVDEGHANAFAGGVLYDHDRVTGLWDGEVGAESVAHVANHLGISFEAALVGMKIHLRRRVVGIEETGRSLRPHEAFRAAGHGDFVDWYESMRGLRRLPAILDHTDLLEQALASPTTE